MGVIFCLPKDILQIYYHIIPCKKNLNSKFKMADADKYLGKYDRTVAEKYDEFLSELGVNFLLRKAATVSSPVFEVTYDAGSEEWLFKKSTKITREFAGDEVIVISQVIGSDLICTQKFKKQDSSQETKITSIPFSACSS